MDSNSFLNKLKKRFLPKEDVVEDVPENWMEEEKQGQAVKEDGTIRVIYEPKKTPLYIVRRIKRLFCMVLILINVILLGTGFFVQGGVMIPFFVSNTAFLIDYFWKTRPKPLEKWK